MVESYSTTTLFHFSSLLRAPILLWTTDSGAARNQLCNCGCGQPGVWRLCSTTDGENRTRTVFFCHGRIWYQKKKRKKPHFTSLTVFSGLWSPDPILGGSCCNGNYLWLCYLPWTQQTGWTDHETDGTHTHTHKLSSDRILTFISQPDASADVPVLTLGPSRVIMIHLFLFGRLRCHYFEEVTSLWLSR